MRAGSFSGFIDLQKLGDVTERYEQTKWLTWQFGRNNLEEDLAREGDTREVYILLYRIFSEIVDLYGQKFYFFSSIAEDLKNLYANFLT